MNDTKFIGLDVHKTSISAAVLDGDGKLVMQSVFATYAAAIVSFIHGLRGTLGKKGTDKKGQKGDIHDK